MKILYLAAFFFDLSLQAQTIHIQQLEENYDVHQLSKSIEYSGTLRNTKSLKELNEENDKADLPQNQEVINNLKKAGLFDEAASLDPLERDELYLRALHFDIDKLIKFYPLSNKKSLENLILLRQNIKSHK